MSMLLSAILLAFAAIAPNVLGLANQVWPNFPLTDPENPHWFLRGPGGYLAWWKLLPIALLFLAWVRLADWMNVDCQRFSARTRIDASLWNLLVVGVFLFCFVALLFIPIFWVGLPIYLCGVFVPFVSYVVMRNSRVPEHQAVLTKTHLARRVKGDVALVEAVDEDTEGPPINFVAGGTPQESKVNQIRARQISNFRLIRSLFHDVITSRADTVLGQRSSHGTQWRKRIDGVWHPLPAMDREIGDATVASLKYLSGIDPQSRTPQTGGYFTIKTEEKPLRCETSVTVQNQTESLRLRLVEAKPANLTLEQLGMFPESVEQLKKCLSNPGLIIVSANPGAGLTTTWHSALVAADRVTRDWVAIIDHDELETRVENIEVNRFDSRQNQSPRDLLRSILLKQPDALVMPKIADAATMDAMTHQVLKERRIVVTRIPARSAAEALLRALQVAGRRGDLVAAVTAVTGQRLARRLCDACKQPMAVSPEMIRQLGGDPANPPTIYKQYAKPHPPPVDKKGRPIEIEPCKKCAGVGYFGRIGLIELIVVDDSVREVLAKQPDLSILTNVALQKRNQSALQQGYRHILAGVTSLAEIQRVFKESE